MTDQANTPADKPTHAIDHVQVDKIAHEVAVEMYGEGYDAMAMLASGNGGNWFDESLPFLRNVVSRIMASKLNVKSVWQGNGCGMSTFHQITAIEQEDDGSLTLVIPHYLNTDEFDKHLLELNATLLHRLGAAAAREGILRDTIRLNHEQFMEYGGCTNYAEDDLHHANHSALNMPDDDTVLNLVLQNKLAEVKLAEATHTFITEKLERTADGHVELIRFGFDTWPDWADELNPLRRKGKLG